MLIISRSKLYYIASSIITPVGGHPVHRLREDWLECMGVLIIIKQEFVLPPPVALQSNADHGLLILEVSRSHTMTHHSS